MEVLIGVLVLAVLVGVAVPVAAGARERSADRAAQAQLRSLVGLVQSEVAAGRTLATLGASALTAAGAGVRVVDDPEASASTGVVSTFATTDRWAGAVRSSTGRCFLARVMAAGTVTFARTSGACSGSAGLLAGGGDFGASALPARPALWLDGADASSFTVDSSGQVTGWNDRSGNNRHLTGQTTNGSPPSGLQLGGGWGQGERTPAALGEVLVYPRQLSDAERQATEAYLAAKWGVAGPSGVNPARAPGASLWLDATQSGTMTLDEDGGIEAWRSADGGSLSVAPSGVTGSMPTGLTIGGGTGESERTAAAVGEVLIYPRRLSDADRQATEAYLAAKWGLPGPAGVTPQRADAPALWLDATQASTVRVTDGSVTGWDNAAVGGSGGSGLTATSGFENATGSAPAGLQIGGGWASGERSAGAFGEVLVYPRELTTAEREQVEAYLAARWGTPAPPGATGTAPTTPLAGSVLHLDARDAASVERDDAGRVLAWRDRSGSGNDLTPPAASGGATVPNGLTLGGGSGAGERTAAAISEVIVYPRALTDAERQAAERHLAAKWGLAAPTGGGTLPSGARLHLDASQTASVVRNADGGVVAWNDVSGNGDRLLLEGPGGSAPSGLQLGGGSNGELTQSLVSEVLVYPRELSETERRQTEAYLAEKWGLTGPTGTAARAPGAVLWMDASDAATMVTDANGRITRVNDRSGQGNHLLTARPNGTSPNGLHLGGWGTGAQRTPSAISEVIIYPRELTTEERQQTEAYLAQKWGLGGPTGTATMAPGAVLWLDATDGASVVRDGSGNVTAWRDKSGSDVELTPTNGAAGLALDPNGLAPGRVAVTTDGLTSLSTRNQFGTRSTVLVVARWRGTGAGGRVVASVNNNWLLGWHGGQQDVAHFDRWVVGPSGPARTSAPQLYTGVSGDNGPRVFRNGTELNPGAGITLEPEGMNGLPAVRTDGTEFLRTTGTFGPRVTVLAVARYSGTGPAGRIVGATNNWLLGWHNGREDVAHFDTWLAHPGAPVTTEGRLYSSVSGNGPAQVWRNGTPLTTSAITLDATGLNGRPAVVTDGRSVLRTASQFGATTTVLAVARWTGTGPSQRIVAGTNNNWLLGWWGGRENVAHFDRWVVSSGVTATSQARLYSTVTGTGVEAQVWAGGNPLVTAGTSAGVGYDPTGLNGQPAVVTDGSQVLRTVNSFGSRVTVFTVARWRGTGSAQRLLSGWSNNWLLGWHGGREDVAHFDRWVVPPGARAATTTPRMYSAVTGSGGPARVWRDGRQGAMGIGITYDTDAINGLPAVLTDGTGVLRTASTFGTEATVFVVAKWRGVGPAGRILAGGTNNWLLGWHGGVEDRAFFDAWVASTGRPLTAAPRLYSAVTGAGGPARVWRSGTSILPNGIRLQTDRINGRPAVVTDGLEVLQTPAGTTFGTRVTVIAVARWLGTGTPGRIISGRDNNWLLGWHSGLEDLYHPNLWVVRGNNRASQATKLYTSVSGNGPSLLWAGGVSLTPGMSITETIGDRPVLTTDGANVLRTTSSLTGSTATAFVVARPMGPPHIGRFLSGWSTNYLVGWHAGREAVAHPNRWLVWPGRAVTNTSRLFVLESGPTGGRLWEGSRLVGSDPTAFGVPVGFAVGGNGSERERAAVAEVLIFDGTLSDEQRLAVTEYLTAKWRL